MNTLSSLLNFIGNFIGSDPDTLATESKTAVGAINELATDYIIEQGTSGFWNYRKWNSGVAECWGRTTQSNKSFSAWGTGYSFDTTAESYPAELFVSAPICVCVGSWGGRNSVASPNSYLGSKTVTPTLTFFRPSAISGNNTATLQFYAIGLWK